MNAPNFTASIIVDESPEKVFEAVTNVRGWWSEEIEGATAKLNDVFIYHYKDVHYCKVKLIEAVPGKKVTWQVLDNFFSFTKDKAEWIDTTVDFVISKEGNQTKLQVTHVGLVPEYECYEICRDAWTNYITNSLKNLITTGKGQPNPKGGEGFNAQIVEKWKLQ
jgi:uncharacterized protein YndB with AHSA1/START domain